MAKKKGIVRSALILTAAGLITRLLGFAYRIYMSQAIGAEGMGLYQLIMPLYALAWSISCSGITTTVSKLVAAENAKKQFGNMGRVVKVAVGITAALGFGVLCVFLFCADAISTGLFNDPRAAMSIKILSLAIPFMAVGSAVRGYFTGLSEMAVPATSQVLEQCVRMSAIYLAAQTMVPRGLDYACAAAVIGILAGEVISFLYVLYTYNTHRLKWAFNSRTPDTATKAVLISMVSMALPLTLNRITGSLLATVESILIPRGLQLYGMSSGEAIAQFGRISGMVMPLIFFPTAFLMSLSTSIVPAVSEAVATNRVNNLRGLLTKSFLFTILVGVGAATVFATLPNELGMVIYRQDIGHVLFLLSFICPLWYLSITINGVLNGLGAMSAIFRNNLISSGINILSILLLVPRFGITAFAIGWFTGVAAQVTLGMHRVRKSVDLRAPIGDWLIKPILSAAAAGLVCKLAASRLIMPMMGLLPGLALSVLLLLIMYLLFLTLLGVISGQNLFKTAKRLVSSVSS